MLQSAYLTHDTGRYTAS